MAAVAIAVSFFVIIVAVAVSSGFRHAIREGVAQLTGDIRIAPRSDGEDNVPMPRHIPSEEAILSLPGVQEIVPVVVRAGIVKQGDTVHGVLVKGVPGIPGQAGKADTVERKGPSLSIPRRLSEITGLGVGDAMTIYFVGEKVRVRRFAVSAIHQDLLELDDNLLVYAPLEDMQRLNGWSPEQVSCLDVRVTPEKTRSQVEWTGLEISTRLLDNETEEDLLVSTASGRYPQVFDWLGLLDFNVLIILLLMTLVAGFNMVSGLLVMLLRNIATIGTLKTMGMDNGAIGRLFVTVGAKAVLKGMLAGNVLALLFCWVQGTWHLIPLDPANYFVSWVPVHVNVLWILGADALAFLGILALLWLPSRVIARIDPAASVKAD